MNWLKIIARGIFLGMLILVSYAENLFCAAEDRSLIKINEIKEDAIIQALRDLVQKELAQNMLLIHREDGIIIGLQDSPRDASRLARFLNQLGFREKRKIFIAQNFSGIDWQGVFLGKLSLLTLASYFFDTQLSEIGVSSLMPSQNFTKMGKLKILIKNIENIELSDGNNLGVFNALLLVTPGKYFIHGKSDNKSLAFSRYLSTKGIQRNRKTIELKSYTKKIPQGIILSEDEVEKALFIFQVPALVKNDPRNENNFDALQIAWDEKANAYFMWFDAESELDSIKLADKLADYLSRNMNIRDEKTDSPLMLSYLPERTQFGLCVSREHAEKLLRHFELLPLVTAIKQELVDNRCFASLSLEWLNSYGLYFMWLDFKINAETFSEYLYNVMAIHDKKQSEHKRVGKLPEDSRVGVVLTESEVDKIFNELRWVNYYRFLPLISAIKNDKDANKFCFGVIQIDEIKQGCYFISVNSEEDALLLSTYLFCFKISADLSNFKVVHPMPNTKRFGVYLEESEMKLLLANFNLL